MSRFLSAIPDVLLVLGLVAVAVGAGLVFLPAGLIVGGLEAAALGVLLDRHSQAFVSSSAKTPNPRREGERG